MNISDAEAKRIKEKFTADALEKLLSEIYGKWMQHCRRHSCPFSSVADLQEKSDARAAARTQSMSCPVSECDDASVERSLSKILSGTPRVSRLKRRDCEELRAIALILKLHIDRVSQDLLKQLKRRDNLLEKKNLLYQGITVLLRRCDKRQEGEEERMKFSKVPGPGDSGFSQWHEAMKMVCRLPGGIPAEFRKTLWLTLSEQHLLREEIEWAKVERICFNERSNPDDEELGAQIVKDLHRTGCSSFCGGAEAEFNQALLKRVLLAYARWNKKVGYCQGFNMLAALLLEVMDHDQAHALKAMIYLVEGVLPPDYFSHSLRGLSVDMAAFRDLLRLRLPELSKHLDQLQNEARDGSSGSSYEPPLVNVFTMQWFLTLFSTCLPQPTVLRVWDLVFLEGSEILLRTALALWEVLENRISHVESADEFYSIMAVLTREMVQFGLMDTNELIEKVVTVAPFPFPGLSELRDKYTYNIAPWMEMHGSKKSLNFRKVLKPDGDDDDDEESRIAIAAVFSNMFPILRSKESGMDSSAGRDQPRGAFGTQEQSFTLGSGASTKQQDTLLKRRMSAGLESVRACGDRANLDISALKNQYSKLRERQRQAHVILTGAAAKAPGLPLSSHSAVAMNHLLLGKKALSRQAHRMARTAAAPLKSRAEFGFRMRPPGADSSREGRRRSTSGTGAKNTISRENGEARRVSGTSSTELPASGQNVHQESGSKFARRSRKSDSSSSSTELCDGLGDDTDDDFDEITDVSVESRRDAPSGSPDPCWAEKSPERRRQQPHPSESAPASKPAVTAADERITLIPETSAAVPHHSQHDAVSFNLPEMDPRVDDGPIPIRLQDGSIHVDKGPDEPAELSRDAESVGSFGSSLETTSVASGLGGKYSISIVRRQRSFDAQKVIEENLEILEKLRLNRIGSHTRNNSTNEDMSQSSTTQESLTFDHPHVVQEVFESIAENLSRKEEEPDQALEDHYLELLMKSSKPTGKFSLTYAGATCARETADNTSWLCTFETTVARTPMASPSGPEPTKVPSPAATQSDVRTGSSIWDVDLVAGSVDGEKVAFELGSPADERDDSVAFEDATDFEPAAPSSPAFTDSAEEISESTRYSSSCKSKPSKSKAKPFNSATPVFIEPTKPINFNPFPSRSRKTHNEVAVKLGLYPNPPDP